MDETNIRSVGIDIGTTTTQLVFSSLTLRNTAGPTQVPRYAITARDIMYHSPVVFTPKKRARDAESSLSINNPYEDVIDEKELSRLILSWYDQAGIKKNDITTGAVIITGESLKTRNARETVMGLADALGDFVVATAGPHLESVIAGRGSGASALSAKHRNTVLNIDIGGGTSNYAVFHNGTVMDTACLAIGGRLVELSPEGHVIRLHNTALPIIKDVFGALPAAWGPDELDRLADKMADLIYDGAVGTTSPLMDILLQTAPLKRRYHYDAVTISGGVGACLAEMQQPKYRFGDMGPLLAAAMRRHPGLARLPLTASATTVQATVIGAGAWSLSLSGSTIWAENDVLPLRNIPVVTVPHDWSAMPENLQELISTRMTMYDLDRKTQLFVLAFDAMPTTYAVAHFLAVEIAKFWKECAGHRGPLIVALREDMGKALGMELKPLMGGTSLIVVDEIVLSEGDYLDLGKPLEGGRFVPLIIKSLAFSGETSHNGPGQPTRSR